MYFTLNDTIKIGQKIKTINGWRKIKEVTEEGAIVKEGVIKFGQIVYGWKKV